MGSAYRPSAAPTPCAHRATSGVAPVRAHAARTALNARSGQRAARGPTRQCGWPVRHAGGTPQAVVARLGGPGVASSGSNTSGSGARPVPPDIAAGLAAMARPTALRKPDCGARGIATDNVFRRLVSRKLTKSWADTFDHATRTFQDALQARAGTDALAAQARSALSPRPGAVLVTLDGRSAYDSMSRVAFLSKLREVAPELFAFEASVDQA